MTKKYCHISSIMPCATMSLRFIAVLIVLCAVANRIMGQDTVQRLDEVEISSQREPSRLRATTPTQVVTAETMAAEGQVLLSDALQRMTGLTLKDYGGIGGIKTVSARGLGSQFSTLTIDGVAVGDAQNGQVDLGRYVLGNSAYISFANGQQEGLSTARAAAAGSTVNMVTAEPRFILAERNNIRIGLEGGSYGLCSPTLLWEHKMNRQLTMSLYGSYLRSDGNYPYTLYYTHNRQDSSSVERRKNSRMRMGTIDANLFYRIDQRQRLCVKAHWMGSYHQLPGPVVLYSSKASEHSEAQVLMMQGRYEARFGQWEVLGVGKYQVSHDLYEDTAGNSASRLIRNRYRQQEGYVGGAGRWHIDDRWEIGMATDGIVNTLTSNLKHDNAVVRWSWLTTVQAGYHHPRITIDAQLLATMIDETSNGSGGSEERSTSYRRLTPYIGVTAQPIADVPLRVRYFYKETYRVPNFSEMYFFTLPRELRPEKATQHNIGLTYSHIITQAPYIQCMATVDGYYNRVSDKLLAIPTQNMYLWSMSNVGLVDIGGAEVRSEWTLLFDPVIVRASVGYALQYAIDHSDPESKTYGHQIPYTPRHSGSGSVEVETPWVTAGYNVLVVGRRYYRQQNTEASLLPAYSDHGIWVARCFDLPVGTLKVRGQVLNLFNIQYEVVKSYPMMGRNYRLSVSYEF